MENKEIQTNEFNFSDIEIKKSASYEKMTAALQDLTSKMLQKSSISTGANLRYFFSKKPYHLGL